MSAYSHARNVALYHGDLVRALEIDEAARIEQMQQGGNSGPRAHASMQSRSMLHLVVGLEGWGVAMARWMLEAAATGHAQFGRASELFEACSPALSPTVEVILSRIRLNHRVLRHDVVNAISQCLSHHRMWSDLAGIDEFTRFYWRPLHFAAALGSVNATLSILDAGPQELAPRNAVGHTPLHVAVAHGSVDAVAALVARGGTTVVEALDREEHTAEDLALETAPSEERCRSLLTALGRTPRKQVRRLCKAAARRRKTDANQRQAKPPDASADGGGWFDNAADGGAYLTHRPCNLAVARSMEVGSLVYRHLAKGVPLLVKEGVRTEALHSRWRRDRFLHAHGSLHVRPEVYPYAQVCCRLCCRRRLGCNGAFVSPGLVSARAGLGGAVWRACRQLN